MKIIRRRAGNGFPLRLRRPVFWRGLGEFMRTIRIFAYFLYLLVINRYKLSEDVERNYGVAKEICRKTFLSAGITVEKIDHDNIPETPGVVIVPNHKSLFDIMALILVVDRTMGTVAAKEMYIPFLRKYISAIGCVRIDRYIDSPVDKEEVVRTQKKIVSLLSGGYCLTIFPEGRLVPGDDLGEFRTASFNAPKKTDAYIVPTYIHGSEGINRKGRWFCFPKAHIVISFGKAIKPSEAGVSNTTELCDVVRERILEQKDEIMQALTGSRKATVV